MVIGVEYCRSEVAASCLASSLAHKIQDAIDRGVARDRAEVARRLGLTRARLTQLMDLTLLAPDIQEQILFAESVDGVEPMSERDLRTASRQALWSGQRSLPSSHEAH